MQADTPTTGSGQADPYAQKCAWESFVVPAARAGKLEKIPTRRAQTPREHDQARAQNAVLARRTFGSFGDRYDAIDWEHSRGN